MVSIRTIRTLSFTPALVGVFALTLLLLNANRVVLGVSAGSQSIAGSTYPDAEHEIAQEVRQYTLTPITLVFGDKTFTTTVADLGFTLETTVALHDAWRIGRSGSLPLDLYEQIAAILTRPTIQFPLTQDENRFTITLDRLFTTLDEPAINANLVWNRNRGTFEETPSKRGRIVDRAPLALFFSVKLPSLEPIDRVGLALVDELPTITEAQIEEGLSLFDAILDQTPRRLATDPYTRSLLRSTVAPWLMLVSANSTTVGVDINATAVDTWLEEFIVPFVNRDAQDALFDLDDSGRVIAFALARDGQMLDQQDAYNIIRRNLLSLDDSTEVITLPVLITEPAIGNDAADALGLRELLAVGETTFAGSPKNRQHNIAIGANLYDGILIGPGEEFSFNQILGPVTAATGYKPELVIKPEGTVPEYGGGLCQVSTTAFQAAVRAGLKITQRRNHSYIVRYYGDPGFDATIYPPYTDLKFLNDTPEHILVQTEIIGTTIRFYYYGTDDGRTIEIDGPHTLTLNKDGSGSAVLSVTTTSLDGESSEQVFRSYYKSPAAYPIANRNPLE